ncbi:hypothetical protein GFS60_04132 [Rhodococcus sp. WAY2]|nr:hypothetical protein GFS60_04132 [Rhodococcus sp. WAY2]
MGGFPAGCVVAGVLTAVAAVLTLIYLPITPHRMPAIPTKRTGRRRRRTLQ